MEKSKKIQLCVNRKVAKTEEDPLGLTPEKQATIRIRRLSKEKPHTEIESKKEGRNDHGN